MVKPLRFFTIVLVSVGMAPAIAHFLEMSAKLNYDGPLWLTVSHTLYRNFGAIGGWIEIAAVAFAWLLVIAVRSRHPALGWTLAGAVFLSVSHFVYWFLIAPVNTVVATLTPETLPPNWTDLRLRWEYSHAARAVLQTLGLAMLVISILADDDALPRRPVAASASLT